MGFGIAGGTTIDQVMMAPEIVGAPELLILLGTTGEEGGFIEAVVTHKAGAHETFGSQLFRSD